VHVPFATASHLTTLSMGSFDYAHGIWKRFVLRHMCSQEILAPSLSIYEQAGYYISERIG
jgi:hypothetical protein